MGSQETTDARNIRESFLAYKYPCCESCIAGEYDMSAERLRDRMENYFGMRPCQGL